MARRFVSLVVAALPTTALMTLMVLAEPLSAPEVVLPVVVLTGLILWQLCGLAYISRRRPPRLRGYLVLGSVLGFIEPAVSVLLVAVVGQFVNPYAPSIGATLNSAGPRNLTVLGLLEAPFGLVGGWLFWRVAIKQLEAPPPRHPKLYRRWQDLRKLHLMIGLALAACVLGGVIIGAVVLLRLPMPGSTSLIGNASGTMALAEIWFLALGSVYLFVVSRRRGTVHRGECLFLGALITSLFSFLFGAIRLELELSAADVLAMGQAIVLILESIWESFVGSALLLPVGVLSGWIFWQVGVRSAPHSDLAPIVV